MEKINLRLNAANKALNKFHEAIKMPKNPISRDVTLLRFQLVIETAWKLAQHYLRDKEGLEVNSPKGAVRTSLQQGILSEEESHILLEIVDDRNLIVHTYNEMLAEQLYQKMPEYYKLLERWIFTLGQKLKD